jgi:hypothetical protein
VVECGAVCSRPRINISCILCVQTLGGARGPKFEVGCKTVRRAGEPATVETDWVRAKCRAERAFGYITNHKRLFAALTSTLPRQSSGKRQRQSQEGAEGDQASHTVSKQRNQLKCANAQAVAVVRVSDNCKALTAIWEPMGCKGAYIYPRSFSLTVRFTFEQELVEKNGSGS